MEDNPTYVKLIADLRGRIGLMIVPGTDHAAFLRVEDAIEAIDKELQTLREALRYNVQMNHQAHGGAFRDINGCDVPACSRGRHALGGTVFDWEDPTNGE